VISAEFASTAGALAAAGCFGAAAVLQAIGARQTKQVEGIDPRLLWRVARSVPYLVGLSLDLVGFLLALTAMRSLPVFAVEAIFASYVAFAAILATVVLKARLRPTEWLALGGVGVGLAMVVSSAGTQRVPPDGAAARIALLVTLLVLGAAAVVVGRLRSRWAVVIIAFLAGLVWGVIPIAVRLLRDPVSVTGLLGDPAAYIVVAAAGLGLLLDTTALQRTSVTVATAMILVGETFVPALAGLVFLGDQPRPGTELLAGSGFILIVGGGLILARYGEIERDSALQPAATDAAVTRKTQGSA